MNAFLRKPSFGGMLSIANGVAWIGVIMMVRSEAAPEPILLGVAFILSLPLALLCFMPALLGNPGSADPVFTCIIIGLNAFVWGYGVEWLWRKVLRRS